jgi:hypothetical protein
MTPSAAMARIEMSRERIRVAMQGPASAGPTPGQARGSWMSQVKDVPFIGVIVNAVHSWWSQHPLRPVSMVISQISAVLTRPIAQRKPVTLMLVAAAGGAILVWSKPWRWMFRSALLAGLAPQVVSRLVANMPIESWMTLLGAAMAQSGAQPPGAERTSTDRDSPVAPT